MIVNIFDTFSKVKLFLQWVQYQDYLSIGLNHKFSKQPMAIHIIHIVLLLFLSESLNANDFIAGGAMKWG